MPDMVMGFSAAAGVASENPYFGTPRNPYNPNHIVGGTSGGNGVAVAARMIPAAIGEDTNGSIRMPAAACGIVGYRPSTFTTENGLNHTNRKRYSDAGLILDAPGPQDTLGPMTRSVSDVVFLDNIITGESSLAIELRRVRLAIPRPDYWEQDFVDPGVARVMTEAFTKLRAAGAVLVEIDFNAVRAINDKDLDWAIRRPEPKNALEEWLGKNVPGVTSSQLSERLADPDKLFTMGLPPEDMPAEVRKKVLTAAGRRYAEVFQRSGALAVVYPTLTIPAPAFDGPHEIPGATIAPRGKPVDKAMTFIRDTFWGPTLGAPSLSIPAGLTAGLPVNLELSGLPGGDRRILGLGLSVEKVLGPLPPPPLAMRRA